MQKVRPLKSITLSVFLFFISTPLFAQNTKIMGTVNDSKSGETLIGASILVKTTTQGTSTDLDGKYTIALKTAGIYTLVVSYIGYQNKTIEGVNVKENQILTLNISLENNAKLLGEVQITAQASRENTNTILVQQRNAPTLSNGISADLIRRSPDRNTGEVIKRVSGVSIQDNKFAIIRGLSDRYNIAMVNGLLLPSTESDRKSFSFDLFPSSLIDNIVIIKTATADLPSEFAGGIIQLNTKEIPEQNFTNFQIGTSGNSQTTFKKNTNYKGGKIDFLGFDDGTRNLPKDFPDRAIFQGNTYTQQQKVDLAKQLPNNWNSIQANSTAPNQAIQFSTGFNKTLNEAKQRTFGAIVAVTYNQSFRTTFAERRQFDAIQRKIFQYDDTQFRTNVLGGVLVNLGFKINEFNKINFKNSYNINANDLTVVRQGENFDNAQDIRGTLFQFSTNKLFTSQMSGEHFVQKSKIRLGWNVGYNGIYRTLPDQRSLVYFKDSSEPTDTVYTAYVPFGSASPDYAGRFFSYLNERVWNENVFAILPFKIKNQSQSLKIGVYSQSRNRTFNARVFGLVINNPSQFRFSILDQTPDKIFRPENLALNGFRLDEVTNGSDEYTAQSTINAAYFVFDNKITNRLRVNWGLRYEQFTQKLNSFFNTQPLTINSKFNNLLPSANLIYNLTQKSNIRLAASQTLSRAEFRELAPFSFYDFNNNSNVLGNEKLVPTQVTNLDLRFERYPSAGETFSVSVFYKYFKNPIEQIYFSTGVGSQTRTFENAQTAQNLGVELEFRRTLAVFNEVIESDVWENITLFSNLAYIKSVIEFEVTNSDGSRTKNERPMQAQSPYIINVGLQYTNTPTDIVLTALFNQIGRRLMEVGNVDYPDIYEAPRGILDFQVSKTFNKKIEIRVSANDVLNQKNTFYQDIDKNKTFNADKDNLINQFTLGRNLGLSVNYKF